MDHRNTFKPGRAGLGILLGAGCLLLGGCATYTDSPPQAAAQDCPDVSGNYSNRGTDARGEEVNLSALFGFSPGATRVVLSQHPGSLRVTAYYVNAVVRDLAVPSSGLSCFAGAVIYEFDSRIGADYRYEARPASSLERELRLRKGSDGSLEVQHASSDKWIAPVLWGDAMLFFTDSGWARFEQVKAEPAASGSPAKMR